MTVKEIVERMDWLAQQPSDVLEELRKECLRKGHIPTGERIMVNPPIDTCFRCGAEYREVTK